MGEQTPKRSKWQIATAKKYPKLTYVGGDGGNYECWIVMTIARARHAAHLGSRA